MGNIHTALKELNQRQVAKFSVALRKRNSEASAESHPFKFSYVKMAIAIAAFLIVVALAGAASYYFARSVTTRLAGIKNIVGENEKRLKDLDKQLFIQEQVVTNLDNTRKALMNRVTA